MLLISGKNTLYLVNNEQVCFKENNEKQEGDIL